MKNQYLGDINDYLKYGILRCLISKGLTLGVFWMLTPDDKSSDGSKLRYFSDATWKDCDPELFLTLSRIVPQSSKRNITTIETLGLLPGARFFAETLQYPLIKRQQWFSRGMKALKGMSLLFFDPDTGFEVSSVKLGTKNSSKYVYWDEIAEAWRSGSSIIVFQHFAHENRKEHLNRLTSKLATVTQGSAIGLVQTSHVAFLITSQTDHRESINYALQSLVGKWQGKVKVTPV